MPKLLSLLLWSRAVTFFSSSIDIGGEVKAVFSFVFSIPTFLFVVDLAGEPTNPRRDSLLRLNGQNKWMMTRERTEVFFFFPILRTYFFFLTFSFFSSSYCLIYLFRHLKFVFLVNADMVYLFGFFRLLTNSTFLNRILVKSLTFLILLNTTSPKSTV